MKNNNLFLKIVKFGAEAKFLVAMYFMLFMIVGSFGSYFLHGMREYSIITIWQIMGASIVFTLLHAIQLTKLNPIIRILIHGTLSYAAVIVFSLLCGWGFTETTSIFLQFTITFVLAYAGLFIGFTLYYKSEEEDLNRKLAEYNKCRQ